MAGSTAADFTPDFWASMAVGFIPGCTNFMPARFRQGFMNFTPAASTRAILANSTVFGEFHRFDHHGFRRGLVVVPAFGAWWSGGWGWPDYYYPNGGYYGSGPYAGYWYYCADPPGYYPYVTQCNTAWQTVPAS